MTSCPFFHTHHAPAGAWSSLTFGGTGTAVSVDFQEPNVKKSGALLAGAAFPGGLRTIAIADHPRQGLPARTAVGAP